MPPPSHGGNTGSNPVGDTNEFSALLDQAATCAGCIRYYMHRAVLPLSGRGKVSVASGRPTMCYHPLFRRASARFFPLTRPRQTDRGEGVAALLAQTRATPRLCARSSSRAAPGHHLGRGARDIGLPRPYRPQRKKRASDQITHEVSAARLAAATPAAGRTAAQTWRRKPAACRVLAWELA